CSADKTLIQTCLFCLNTVFIWLLRFTQTKTVGGVSVIEQTAVAVIPQVPASPCVVTIFTAAANLDIALRKFCCSGVNISAFFAIFLYHFKSKTPVNYRRLITN